MPRKSKLKAEWFCIHLPNINFTVIMMANFQKFLLIVEKLNCPLCMHFLHPLLFLTEGLGGELWNLNSKLTQLTLQIRYPFLLLNLKVEMSPNPDIPQIFAEKIKI